MSPLDRVRDEFGVRSTRPDNAATFGESHVFLRSLARSQLRPTSSFMLSSDSDWSLSRQTTCGRSACSFGGVGGSVFGLAGTSDIGSIGEPEWLGRPHEPTDRRCAVYYLASEQWWINCDMTASAL